MRSSRKIRVRRSLYIFAFWVMFYGFLAHAAFHCEDAGFELEKAKSSMTSEQRVVLMQAIFGDIKNVVQEILVPKELSPRKFLESCLATKRESFEMHRRFVGTELARSVDLNLMLGEYSYFQKQFEVAVQFFERAISVEPTAYKAYWWRLRAWHEAKKDDAISPIGSQGYFVELEGLLKPLTELRSVPFDLQVEALDQLGKSYIMLKRGEDAFAVYKKVMSVDPSNESAIQFLVKSYFDRNNTEEALRFLSLNLAYVRSPSGENNYILKESLARAKAEKNPLILDQLKAWARKLFPKDKAFQ